MKGTKIGGPGKMFAVGEAKSQTVPIPTLFGLSPDKKGVYHWTGTPDKWTKIGGPASEIYAGGDKFFATNPQSGDIYQYKGQPMKGTKIGGPGKMFAVGEAKSQTVPIPTLFGLSPDKKGVYHWTGTPDKGTKIGGPAESICAGDHSLCARSPNVFDVWHYSP